MDTAITPTNRTIQPALQSISQDDATVSNIHNPGQQQQQQLQFAQQHELVQPGQNNFDPLQLQTNFPYTQQQQFPSHTHSASQFQAQTMSAPGGENYKFDFLFGIAHNAAVDMSQFSPFQQSLDLQQPMTPSSHIMQDQFFPATPQTHHTGMSPQLSSQAFQAPMAPPMERASSLMSQQGPPSPSKQQMDDLRDHVEALYGKGVSINIGVLPTPVATPSKRSCVSDKIDASPIPFSLSDGPEVNFAPAPSVDILASMDRSLSDKGYVSPVFSPAHMSPSQSFMGSPVLASSNGFDAALASSDIVFGEDTLTSFVGSPPGVLTDGEASSPQSNSTHFSSSSRTPKPTSLANHNINGCIKPTGIDPELISVYISEQDPVTHKWKCLHPGCRHPWFGRRENIRAHVQTHLGDRQFMCNVCNKRFVRQHDLKRHAKIHMGVKDYVCLCGSTFARMDALTRHRQRGMCSGGFPGAVRSEKKRGRPKKHRPELDARASKAAAQRARNAAHRRADSDDFSSSAASSPGSVASPEPLLHGTDFASLDDAASSPRGDGPAAADLALPLVTSSMEAASLDGPTALGASTLSGGPAPDLAGDTSFDMSTLLSAEPGVAGAAAMQRSSSGDSADSYTTIFDSPVWDGHGGAAAGAPADATGAPAALAFEYVFPLSPLLAPAGWY